MTMRLDVSDAPGSRRLSPTDVSQFVGMASCQRYLRLTMLRRQPGPDLMRQYDVAEQALTPLLTSTGLSFEAGVEAAISATMSAQRLGQESTTARTSDNEVLLREVRRLASGAARVLFQVRLLAPLGEWTMRGDADVVLLRRDAAGMLSILVADIKSSTRPKLEHRLQVAFYARMIETILAGDGVAHAPLELGILYRPSEPDRLAMDPELEVAVRRDRALARGAFGIDSACLAMADDAAALSDTVDDLVARPDSVASQVAAKPFGDVPYHLMSVCDGCRFNEFCMKWTAEHDDLSNVPFLAATEKTQLIRAGVRTASDLAALKRLEPRAEGEIGPAWRLRTVPGAEGTVRALTTRPPVGPRLDELIVRAQAYRAAQGDDYQRRGRIPGGGKGSLPATTPDQHPNLVWVYIDAQKDYLNDRLYLLAARVVACEAGEPARTASIIEMTDGPPDDPLTERGIVGRWAARLVEAVATLAAPEPGTGARRAPIHLVFASGQEMGELLDGLSRHLQEVFGATALYDFVTQPAAYDSPLVTELDTEIRTRMNLPLVAQSLVRTAQYLGFRWDEPRDFRRLFRERLFDDIGRLDHPDGEWQQDEKGGWYMRRARFRSSIPLEYAYGLWGRLERRPGGREAVIEPYLAPSRAEFLAFVERRLDAIVHIAGKLTPNGDAGKSSFDLPDLATFEARAHGLAEALLEFLQIERHVEMAAWRRVRQLEPERRMLVGQAWVATFHDEDQDAETRQRVATARERYAAQQAARERGDELDKETRAGMRWSLDDVPLRFRLRLPDDVGDFGEMVRMSDVGDHGGAILYERDTVDTRLPPEQRQPFTATARQILYGPRVDIDGIEPPEGGRDATLTAHLSQFQGFKNEAGYAFMGHPRPPQDGETYSFDADPNNVYDYGLYQSLRRITDDGRQNTLYERLVSDAPPPAAWPPAAADGQRRFLDGLVALHEAGHFHAFEPSKHEFIGDASAEPFLLVQGPPGTGKSFTTAFALFARLQGALEAGIDLRVAAGCKTHAATDVLLANLVAARERLAQWRRDYPDIAARYFDPRLEEIPILRAEPRTRPAAGAEALWVKAEKANELILPDDRIGLKGLMRDRWSLLLTTPNPIRKLDETQVKHKTQVRPIGCVLLDEASQMNLPEAIVACRLLDPGGQVIVVGDHRQMAPIVKHDWEGERRRTFREYAAYESLFNTLLARQPQPRVIRFAESFRLHADMADFLRQEVYRKDGINYHSNKTKTLDPVAAPDDFVRAVVDPAYPLVVVSHDEATSQTRNDFEVALATPVLRALASRPGFDPRHHLGVVVPHTAQRAAFQAAVPELTLEEGGRTLTAVDTVEKFQGGERDAMVFAATQSDPGYLATRADFLFDPRRITVAMSRAKEKVILVASDSVFTFFSPDEEAFANALLWKNLLRRTCTEVLWQGVLDGHNVTVRGNATLSPEALAVRAGDVLGAG